MSMIESERKGIVRSKNNKLIINQDLIFIYESKTETFFTFFEAKL